MAKRKDEFSEAAWLGELHKASERKRERDGFLSSQEIADAIGCSQGTAASRLRVLFKQGRLEVRREMIAGIDGTPRPVPVYRVKVEP